MFQASSWSCVLGISSMRLSGSVSSGNGWLLDLSQFFSVKTSGGCPLENPNDISALNPNLFKFLEHGMMDVITSYLVCFETAMVSKLF